MSLQFSNPTNKNGIVQLIDATVKSNSVSYPLLDKTRDVNLAFDRVLALIFQVGGTWQFDDSNHTDYPIITRDLASGQRDYTFTTDEQGNVILEIYKVFAKDTDGTYREIFPVDVQIEGANTNYTDGLNVGGIPVTYDKTANGFFLDPIPNYNSDEGLKVYINREASYFTSTDTTKKPGIAGLFHEYFVLRPSYQYALRNSMQSVDRLKGEVFEMEAAIQDFYRARQKDTRKVLRGRTNNFK